MSFSLYAYGDDSSPVTVEELTRSMHQRGFVCRVIRDDEVAEVSQAVVFGALQSEDSFVAWRVSTPESQAAVAEAAVAAADWDAINEFDNRTFAMSNVDINDKPDLFVSWELPEWQERYAAQYVDGLKRSRVQWYSRLVSGRTRFDMELAESILRALLELRGGMFYDPQDGIFQFIQRGEVTYPKRSPSGWIVRAFSSLRKLLDRNSGSIIG